MSVRRSFNAVLALGVGLLASEVTAPAQCMQWAVAGAGGYSCYDLSVDNVGSGPELYAAISGWAARWSGTAWLPVAPMLNDDITALGSYDDGSGPALYAGGRFTALYGSVTQMWHIAKLRGGEWQPVGTGLPTTQPYWSVYSMHVFDDGTGPQLYVGGYFTTIPSISSRNLVRWDGAAWSGVGGGTPAAVGAMCTYDDGGGPALYVGGAVGGVAKWNGSAWSPLGSGLMNNGAPAWAWALAVYDDGNGPALYAGGSFNRAGGVQARGLAKWDGMAWSAVPIPQGGVDLFVRDLAVHDDGNGPALYVTSESGPQPLMGISRWNGSNWLGLGSLPQDGGNCLMSFDDSQGAGPALYAGGEFGYVGGNLWSPLIARWYGGCTHTIDPLCFGDGTFSICPCTNFGTSMHGCENSAHLGGAVLSATGTTNPDTLVLSSTSQPAASHSVFLQSSSLLPSHVTFGDGVLCLEEPLLRLYVKYAASGTAQAPDPGDLSITLRSAALGDPILPGMVRYYQVLYRDTEDFCSTGTFNLSNGLRVVW